MAATPPTHIHSWQEVLGACKPNREVSVQAEVR